MSRGHGRLQRQVLERLARHQTEHHPLDASPPDPSRYLAPLDLHPSWLPVLHLGNQPTRAAQVATRRALEGLVREGLVEITYFKLSVPWTTGPGHGTAARPVTQRRVLCARLAAANEQVALQWHEHAQAIEKLWWAAYNKSWRSRWENETTERRRRPREGMQREVLERLRYHQDVHHPLDDQLPRPSDPAPYPSFLAVIDIAGSATPQDGASAHRAVRALRRDRLLEVVKLPRHRPWSSRRSSRPWRPYQPYAIRWMTCARLAPEDEAMATEWQEHLRNLERTYKHTWYLEAWDDDEEDPADEDVEFERFPRVGRWPPLPGL